MRINPSSKNRGRARFFVFTGIMAVVAAGAWSAYALIRDLPGPERITDRSVAQSTQILDRTGSVLLYEVHGEERRTVIPFSDMPDGIKQATLAAEDLHFYTHVGIDWKGILRAIATNLVRGDFSQGGSTITQQLVKNSLLGSEKTIRRKVREQILALLLERKYSKDQIFELYLNQIPYGSNAYGIAAAAQMYFGKDVRDLSLAEAATLASLPKAPTYYSPYGSHKDDLLKRKDWVLERMAEAGLISREEAEGAKRQHLAFTPPRENMRAPHFVQHVREYLDKRYGSDLVETGGLKVTTTLDWTLQEAAEGAVRDGAEKNEQLVRAHNAALVAVDPKTGEILAMAGSRDYMARPEPEGCTPGANCKFDPYVNVATRSRQPGSAFKPFVYATAFQKGYTPETVLFDVATEFNPSCNPDGSPGPLVRDPKTCYHPRDYDGQFRGPVSLRTALAQSLNVPSVKLLYLTGITDTIKTAEGMGVTTLTDPDRYGLSLVLGGAEVTLLEMTAAYGTFAADGLFHPTSAILKVEDAAGRIMEEKQTVSQSALDPEAARTINDVLSDNDSRVPMFSPHSSLYFSDRQVAAKTGTTQDYRDAWTIGYTPSLVAGVWVGNNDNSAMDQGGVSVMVAGPIWHQFMASALASSTPEQFIPPEKKEEANPALRGIWRQGPIIKTDKISGKLATAYTPLDLIQETGSGAAVSILGLVRHDDPTGPAPEDPAGDPQFVNWQEAINQWIRGNPLPLGAASGESDDIHAPDKAPKIALTTPATSAGEIKEIRASIIGVFPLREVSLFVDDGLASSRLAPLISPIFTFTLGHPLDAGTHTIKIIAYDAVGNRTVLEQNLTVTSD